ncbi:MAG: phosphatase PAP2 family protein [Elusimicrobiaceae bacterium]
MKKLSVYILISLSLILTPSFAETAGADSALQPKKDNYSDFQSIKWTKNENFFGSPAYLKRLGKDLVEMPQKPLHWDKNDWAIAGGIVGGSLLAFTIDDIVRQNLKTQRSGFFTSLSDITTHWGDWKQQIPIFAGTYIVALATKDATLHKIVADGIEASVFAAGIINPILVYATGRDLPNANENAMTFKPMTPGRYSFPSGHTTAAFALSTVIDQNLRAKFGYWQTPIVYAMAAGCGISRVYDHTHYVSEVIFGAGVGWAVGYWISNKPRNQDEQTVFILPFDNGAKIAYKF